jgi:hypothetical protein
MILLVLTALIAFDLTTLFGMAGVGATLILRQSRISIHPPTIKDLPVCQPLPHARSGYSWP